MSGIVGVISSAIDYEELNNCLRKANRIQNHRGPDASGVYIDEKAIQKVGLAHQRLFILDSTESGNQPMVAFDGQSFIIYDGKVYNYIELRNELKKHGYNFISNSDTEVIITAIKHWGIDEALNRFNGMWAFAYLDIKKSKLYLVRDRFGMKPLYYFLNNKRLFFASEIKAILEMTKHKFHLDYQVIGEYLQQSLVESSNNTFFQGINKIAAGSYAEIDLVSDHIFLNLNKYYDLEEHLGNRIECSESDLIEQIRELFFDAVSKHLSGDVPIGVLLSGGVDSSSIAATLKARDDIKFLAAVSNDKRFDESPFIDIMARYLNNPVHKVTLDLNDNNAFELLEKTCWYNDEPVGSFSNVAHFLLMEKAKELGVKVILSGQGADELLCGYRKYLGFHIQSLLRNSRYMNAFGDIMKFIVNGTVINQFSLAEARRYLPKRIQPNIPDIKGEALLDYKPQCMSLEPGMSVRQRQIYDIYKFSVPVITHSEDRMSMAWSREIRIPFLDYRLVELLVNLPIELKLNKGWTKYIFRKAMEPYLPKEIVWRKDKQGFVIPESEWIKYRLKQKVLSYFEKDSLIFKYNIVKRNELLSIYEQYCKQKSGQGSVWHQDVFNPLALEIWLRQNERFIQ